MLRFALIAAALAGCVGTESHEELTLLTGSASVDEEPGGGDEPVPQDPPAPDTPTEDPPSEPEPEPIDCGVLCAKGDRLEMTLHDPSEPWETIRKDELVQSIEVDSMGGELEITLHVTGNFGSAGKADGVTVTVGGNLACSSAIRVAGQPGVNDCTVTVDVEPGHSMVPVTLRQAGGSAGWSIILETAAVVVL